MSICSTPEQHQHWLTGFRRRAIQSRIPVSGMLELTERCNFRCRHCYLGDQALQHANCESELSTEQVKASIREWVDAGCLTLVITGGDPMIRPDFHEIYRYAAEQGLMLVVFCNGTLVTDSIVDLLRQYPPRVVEITLYGATAETYDSITRIPGSFQMAWGGIHRLLAAKVRVALKTTVISLNEHELEAMAEQAEALGCNFRYDAAVFPSLSDGSHAPLDLRISPAVAVAHDMLTVGRRDTWRKTLDRGRDLVFDDRVYQCGAGMSGFFMYEFGSLSPCLMTRHRRCSSIGRPFREVWEQEIGRIRDVKRSRPEESSLYGEMCSVCAHCPAMNFTETGDEELESPHMKRLAELRYQAVMRDKREVKQDE